MIRVTGPLFFLLLATPALADDGLLPLPPLPTVGTDWDAYGEAVKQRAHERLMMDELRLEMQLRHNQRVCTAPNYGRVVLPPPPLLDGCGPHHRAPVGVPQHGGGALPAMSLKTLPPAPGINFPSFQQWQAGMAMGYPQWQAGMAAGFQHWLYGTPQQKQRTHSRNRRHR